MASVESSVKSQDVKGNENNIDQACVTETAESTDQAMTPQESNNENEEWLDRRLSRHKHRMNSRTFKEFFLKIWKKHEGVPHRISGDLAVTLLNMSYNQILIIPPWSDKDCTDVFTSDDVPIARLYQHVLLQRDVQYSAIFRNDLSSSKVFTPPVTRSQNRLWSSLPVISLTSSSFSFITRFAPNIVRLK